MVPEAFVDDGTFTSLARVGFVATGSDGGGAVEGEDFGKGVNDGDDVGVGVCR